MGDSSGVYPVKGVVQHYSWGGYRFLPQLLGMENSKDQPFAEYWLGAHPHHPSVLIQEHLPLDRFIEKDPVRILGDSVHKKFTTLPYLFKILDVRQMLSIQVHPSIPSAIAGFAQENQKGIPHKAPTRNYKDENHKPELMVALSEFWLLHGFKKQEDLERVLSEVPEFSPLVPAWKQGSYRGLYETVMAMSQQEVDALLSPLAKRIVPLYEKGLLEKTSEDFWAARAVQTFCRNGHYDRGIFSVYFFNLLQLHEGEGIFQDSGVPHAYLEGQNAEVMANSDNVLRAGLTDKHVDVPELMKHVHFEPTIPEVLHPGNNGHAVLATPAEEFELHRYRLQAAQQEALTVPAAEIWLLTEGAATINQKNFRKGEACFIPAGTPVTVTAVADACLFRVSVPIQKTDRV